jgi:hypothetical protein
LVHVLSSLFSSSVESPRSYVNNVFSDKQQSTMQGASFAIAFALSCSHPHRAASFLSKRLNINAATVNLAIWDTAGQERFHALGPIYYRDADGDFLLYSAFTFVIFLFTHLSSLYAFVCDFIASCERVWPCQPPHFFLEFINSFPFFHFIPSNQALFWSTTSQTQKAL